jgi:hypothetical protein
MAKAIKGPTGARNASKGTASKHAAAVQRMAAKAKVVKPTTAKPVRTKGLKLGEPQVRIASTAKAVKVRGKATHVEVKGKQRKAAPAVRAKAIDVEVKKAQAKTLQELEEEFESFFRAEIEAELAHEAHVVHDRIARWRCQCCDALLTIPRRTTVLHGDYVLVHDDLQGLLVNGERFVPKATEAIQLHQPGRIKVEPTPLKVTTPDIEVVQPGRFKDPYRHLR